MRASGSRLEFKERKPAAFLYHSICCRCLAKCSTCIVPCRPLPKVTSTTSNRKINHTFFFIEHTLNECAIGFFNRVVKKLSLEKVKCLIVLRNEDHPRSFAIKPMEDPRTRGIAP